MYTLAQLRMDTRYSARNAIDSSEYPDAQVDRAIQKAANRMIRVTKETASLAQATMSIGSNMVTGLPADLAANNVMDAYITLSGKLLWPTLTFTTIESVLQAQLNRWPWCRPGWFLSPQPPTSPPTGRPSLVGASDASTFVTDTLADQAYTLNFWWWGDFTSWVAGEQGPWASLQNYNVGDVVSSGGNLYQAINQNINVAVGTAGTWIDLGAGTIVAPASQTFNISDASLDVISQWGAPGILQIAEPEKGPQAKAMLAEFDSECRRLLYVGVGSRSPKQLFKQPPFGFNGDWSGRGAPMSPGWPWVGDW